MIDRSSLSPLSLHVLLCCVIIIIIIIITIIIIYSFTVFHISVGWWSSTGVWVTASLLKFPRLFSEFWPFSIMLSFRWSPLNRQLLSPPVPLIILYLLYKKHHRTTLADCFSLEFEWQQVSRTLLSILVDLNIAVVWTVSTRPLIFKSSSSCTKPLVTVPRAQITNVSPIYSCATVIFIP